MKCGNKKLTLFLAFFLLAAFAGANAHAMDLAYDLLPNPGANSLKNWGYTIIGGEDLNQDGASDYIVCGYYEGNTGQNRQSKCEVVSGSDLSGLLTLSNPAPQTYNLAAAFIELNNDPADPSYGYIDMLFGGDDKNVGNLYRSGQFYAVQFGADKKGDFAVLDTQILDSPEPQAAAQFGHVVATFADDNLIAVSAPGQKSLAGDADTGKVYFYTTLAGGDLVPVNNVLIGNQAGERFGESMASVGNADGSILAVGAPHGGEDGSGKVLLYSVPGLYPLLNSIDASGTAYDLFGFNIASVGDVTGDGISDLAVSGVANGEGYVIVYDSATLGGSNEPYLVLVHPESGKGQHFGQRKIVGVGDWTCDGKADIAVTSAGGDAPNYIGGEILVFSGERGVSDVAELATKIVNPYSPDLPGDGFGYSFDRGGVNGADLAVGIPGTLSGRGEAVVFRTGTDADEDGVADLCDNCTGVYNAYAESWRDAASRLHFDSQPDRDLDGSGDACDNCQYDDNADQLDTDGDCSQYTLPYLNDPNCGDACEDCPSFADDALCAYIENQVIPDATPTGSGEETLIECCITNHFTDITLNVPKPTCFNNEFTVQTASGTPLQSKALYGPSVRVGAPGDSTDDIIALLPGESYCTDCDMTLWFDDMVAPSGEAAAFQVQCTYVNYIQHENSDSGETILVGAFESGLGNLLKIDPNMKIDIKPGNDDDTVQPGSEGVVSVAMLSASDFLPCDHVNLDPATISMKGNPPKTTGTGELFYSCKDVGGTSTDGDGNMVLSDKDGLDDLIVQILTSGWDENPEPERVILQAQSKDGTPLLGWDNIRLVPHGQ
jgi:hypothetical protein